MAKKKQKQHEIKASSINAGETLDALEMAKIETGKSPEPELLTQPALEKEKPAERERPADPQEDILKRDSRIANLAKIWHWKQFKIRARGLLLIVGSLALFGVLVFAVKAFCDKQGFVLFHERKAPSTQVASAPMGNALTAKQGEIVNANEPADETLWSLLLANTDNPLPADFTLNLTTVSGTSYQFDARAVQALETMMADGNAQGLSLTLCSTYRSHERQIYLFNSMQQNYMASGMSEREAYAATKKWRNLPGTSEHETGLSADIVSMEYYTLDTGFANTPEGKWLYANAANYGFILRYPQDKTAITGTSFEPWHYRYVGIEDAQKIMEQKICLEEYLNEVGEKSETTVKDVDESELTGNISVNAGASSSASSSSSSS